MKQCDCSECERERSIEVERDELRSQNAALQEELYETRRSLTEASKELVTSQRMYDKCFKERDEARARWVLDPIHGEAKALRGDLDRALSELAEAKKALIRYGVHHIDCERDGLDGDCSCGLSAARAAIPEAVAFGEVERDIESPVSGADR